MSTAFVLVVFAILATTAHAAGTFTDDLGVTHTFEGKPTIVTFAQFAIGLKQMGKSSKLYEIILPEYHY